MVVVADLSSAGSDLGVVVVRWVVWRHYFPVGVVDRADPEAFVRSWC
jgi:hypothetical protein